jgi:hypothetical protein
MKSIEVRAGSLSATSADATQLQLTIFNHLEQECVIACRPERIELEQSGPRPTLVLRFARPAQAEAGCTLAPGEQSMAFSIARQLPALRRAPRRVSPLGMLDVSTAAEVSCTLEYGVAGDGAPEWRRAACVLRLGHAASPPTRRAPIPRARARGSVALAEQMLDTLYSDEERQRRSTRRPCNCGQRRG